MDIDFAPRLQLIERTTEHRCAPGARIMSGRM
jgi:hypothetical protein